MPTYAEKQIRNHVWDKGGLAGLADALTNSGIQDIAKSLTKAGLRGGLGDSRKLRADLHATIAANIGHTTAFMIVEQTDFEQERRHTVHLRLVIYHDRAAQLTADKKLKTAHQKASLAHEFAALNKGDTKRWRTAMKHSIRLSVLPHFYE